MIIWIVFSKGVIEMDKRMFELIVGEQQKQELQRIVACNEQSEKFGLALSEAQAKELLVCRKNSLMDSQRIEFGESIISKLIFAFCDSQFINLDSYFEILSDLQDIFYTYKNEAMDEMTDDELIEFMRKQFDEVCFGDIEYLKSTCLERYSRAIRSGYQSKTQKRLRDEYTLRDSENEYTNFSEETGWDYELYERKLEDMY